MAQLVKNQPAMWETLVWFLHWEDPLREGKGYPLQYSGGFPGGSVVKNPPANAGDAGDAGSIPGSRRSPGEGNGNPFQYTCLERGAWRATFHGVTKSWTWLSTHGNKMRSYRICISQSNVFHLAKYPQGPPMLQMAGFYSLLWLNNILVHISFTFYTTFS